MKTSLSIGDFSRATHLSVKTLRYYHRVRLLEPADVDPHTGYRRYTTEQIPTAQIIRRFRDLDMPVHEVQAVLSAPDAQARNTLIAGHLNRLEEGLSRTQTAVASLRDLLRQPSPAEPANIAHRSVEATPALAVTETVDLDDALNWYQGAIGELYATLAAQNVPPAGPAGGIFSGDLFTHERGQATIFVPCADTLRPLGRVSPLVVPAVELATIEHLGPHTGIDRAYGTLATYVTRHALAVEGPIREYYLTGRHDTTDQAQWRTEIGWPIFRTHI
ncbi:MerR family transcriptional regulator [Streptomyces sp. NPDC051572]|uniref:MerR family transcriptional regulator n=1 Tax=Streptomyces sp. NPDC051572 TaxID=3155802 RepID=UPI00344F40DF